MPGVFFESFGVNREQMVNARRLVFRIDTLFRGNFLADGQFRFDELGVGEVHEFGEFVDHVVLVAVEVAVGEDDAPDFAQDFLFLVVITGCVHGIGEFPEVEGFRAAGFSRIEEFFGVFLGEREPLFQRCNDVFTFSGGEFIVGASDF